MKPRTHDECCANCPAWEHLGDSSGDCLINAPAFGYEMSWWPKTSDSQWCIPGVRLMREERCSIQH